MTRVGEGVPGAGPAAATVSDLLKGAARRLRAAGLPEVRREAMALWAGVAGESPGDVWREWDRPVPSALAARYDDAVARRAGGEPAADVLGSAGFRTLDLVVDRRVLIPRPETEGLVERVLRWAAVRGDRGGGLTVADIGTGSGCIALSLAVEAPVARVVAVDASPGALAVAAENVRRVAPPVPVDLRLGELLEPLAGMRVGAIVSNPPYLTDAEYEDLEPAVRDFEPREALVGGPDGLGPTRAVLEGAAVCLEPGGLLALEVDCRRAGWVRDLARASGFADARVEVDLWGRARYLIATRSGCP